MKIGDWLTIEIANGIHTKQIQINITESSIIFDNEFGCVAFRDIRSLRPATPEEIDSVQPKFKRGDVMKNEEGTSTCRLGFSIMPNVGELTFSEDCGTYADLSVQKKPTEQELKNYEQAEMLHGKKWNVDKEDYDDFLATGGLTLKELLEHDTNEIEWFNGSEWIENKNSKSEIKGVFLDNNVIEDPNLARYRLKPKGYVDVEIRWKITEANITPPFNNNDRYDLCDFQIGVPRGGWVLSGYVFDSSFNGNVNRTPMTFGDKGTVVAKKATHARFVRLEGN